MFKRFIVRALITATCFIVAGNTTGTTVSGIFAILFVVGVIWTLVGLKGD
jgi:hypothetical protein